MQRTERLPQITQTAICLLLFYSYTVTVSSTQISFTIAALLEDWGKRLLGWRVQSCPCKHFRLHSLRQCITLLLLTLSLFSVTKWERTLLGFRIYIKVQHDNHVYWEIGKRAYAFCWNWASLYSLGWLQISIGWPYCFSSQVLGLHV